MVSTDSPWMNLSGSVPADGPEQSEFRVETIAGIAPLDRQFGVQPKKTIPDALRDMLFGLPDPSQAEVDPKMRTYGILDAAKVINLPELLGASGLEHRCLFTGDAYDELKNAAPWVVRLEEGNDFIRRLFTGPEGINGLWENEPGIYVRSQGTIEEIWRHLRKFTRLQDDGGDWFYFRFWDVSTVRIFLERADWTNRRPFFSAAGVAEMVLVEASGKATIIRPGEDFGRKGRGKPFLTVSREIIYDRKVAALRDYFGKLTPKRFRAIRSEGQDEFMRHLMRRASKRGITTYSEIAYLGCLMQNFGCWFDMDPAYRRMNRFLSDTEHAQNPHRIDFLHQERTAFVSSCIGDKGEIDLRHRQAIMACLSGLYGRYEMLDRATVSGMIWNETPERAEFIGHQAISDLFRESARLASGFKLEKEWHIGAFTALAYALGIGFFDDPFYPWTHRILVDEESSADERMTRLMQYAEKRLRKSIREVERHVQ